MKIGDMVKLTICYGQLNIGDRGKVCDPRSENNIGVEWQKTIEGHNCGGRCPSGKGYYVPEKYLQLDQVFVVGESGQYTMVNA